MGKYTSPAGRGDDGRAEWRQPVIVGQRFAERALANVAEIAPVAEAATGPAAEIQERRKRAADVARRRRAFVGSFSCPAVRLLRFRHIDLQRCLKGCGHGSSLCLCVFFSLFFSFFQFPSVDSSAQFIRNERKPRDDTLRMDGSCSTTSSSSLDRATGSVRPLIRGGSAATAPAPPALLTCAATERKTLRLFPFSRY